jgi:deoxyribodipyrimidine photo-lyase
MTSARRLADNYALQFAVGEARRLHRPLIILEALRLDYPWASDRFHRFIMDGMLDHAHALSHASVLHYPYVESAPGEARGLLETLASTSCLVVTDEYPCFFLPGMIEAAGRRLTVALIAIDSNGLLPLRATERVFSSAYSFRRELQKRLPEHLEDAPARNVLARLQLPSAKIPRIVSERWPAISDDAMRDPATLAGLPIDHDVTPVADSGGDKVAHKVLGSFLRHRLERYAEQRNHADSEVTSGLSAYLHFGQLSVHRVLRELARQEEWKPARLSSRADGRKEGWWGMGESAEAFLDELVTWRELGYNMTSHQENYDRFESLPGWALATLADHEADPRPIVYTLRQLEDAETHDTLWNAAQRQLRVEGRIHNYLRMLWGKKVIEWTRSPREALERLIHLNNRWAIDGRDPNSYSGIFWCFGRYDRPWPERRIFGKVRYMSSESTRRKTRVAHYLERYGGTQPGQ